MNPDESARLNALIQQANQESQKAPPKRDLSDWAIAVGCGAKTLLGRQRYLPHEDNPLIWDTSKVVALDPCFDLVVNPMVNPQNAVTSVTYRCFPLSCLVSWTRMPVTPQMVLKPVRELLLGEVDRLRAALQQCDELAAFLSEANTGIALPPR